MLDFDNIDMDWCVLNVNKMYILSCGDGEIMK